MHEQDMAVPQGPREGLDPAGATGAEAGSAAQVSESEKAAGWLLDYWSMAPERRDAIREAVMGSFADPGDGHRAWLAGIAHMERTAGVSDEDLGSEVIEDGRCACPHSHGLIAMSEDDVDDSDLIDDVEGWEL